MRLMAALKKYVELLTGRRAEYSLKFSDIIDKEVNKNIDMMKADLNGCTDQWFLKPVERLDECIEKDLEKE
jgi:hypothetical protein